MCGRYRLEYEWRMSLLIDMAQLEERAQRDLPVLAGTVEARPTNLLPILRLDDAGDWHVEARSWGFHRTWPAPGKPGVWMKKELFNAKGETVAQKSTWKRAFAERRCLVPMSGWWEWPTLEGKKTRVDISMPARPVFAAAGLYETSKHNKTGEPVETFTLVTAEPNGPLGTAHDRAPLVLEPEDYRTWLAGGDAALGLVRAHPDDTAFRISPDPDGLAGRGA